MQKERLKNQWSKYPSQEKFKTVTNKQNSRYERNRKRDNR